MSEEKNDNRKHQAEEPPQDYQSVQPQQPTITPQPPVQPQQQPPVPPQPPIQPQQQLPAQPQPPVQPQQLQPQQQEQQNNKQSPAFEGFFSASAASSVSGGFKLGWGFLGFFFGIFSLPIVFIGTMHKQTVIRMLALRYACYGFLLSAVLELLLTFTLGPEFIQMLTNATPGPAGSGASGAPSGGSAF